MRTSLPIHILLFFLILIAYPESATATSSSTPAISPHLTLSKRSLPKWLSPLLPQKGSPNSTLTAELKCYSLPYGGIGFLSHILTYWQIFWLWNLRSPIMPWIHLSMRVWDMWLAIATLVVTPLISIFTIVRCVRRWQFVLVAVWVGLTSGTMGVWTWSVVRGLEKRKKDVGNYRMYIYDLMLHNNPAYGPNHCIHERQHAAQQAAMNMVQSENDLGTDRYHAHRRWLLIYALGVFIALPGLGSIVHQTWSSHPATRPVTYAFLAFWGLPWILFVTLTSYAGLKNAIVNEAGVFRLLGVKETKGWGLWKRRLQYYWGAVLTIVVASVVNGALLACFWFAFYADWVLGAVAAKEGNWAGVPSKDASALYWGFFVAKKLGMISW